MDSAAEEGIAGRLRGAHGGDVKPSRDVPLVLGGVSFGGMLAYEMARHLKPDAVVLIASCRNRRGLRWLYRAGRRLWPLVPAWTWSVAKSFSRPSVLFSSQMSAGERELLNRMFREADNRFMHWTVQAILGWRAVAAGRRSRLSDSRPPRPVDSRPAGRRPTAGFPTAGT